MQNYKDMLLSMAAQNSRNVFEPCRGCACRFCAWGNSCSRSWPSQLPVTAHALLYINAKHICLSALCSSHMVRFRCTEHLDLAFRAMRDCSAVSSSYLISILPYAEATPEATPTPGKSPDWIYIQLPDQDWTSSGQIQRVLEVWDCTIFTVIARATYFLKDLPTNSPSSVCSTALLCRSDTWSNTSSNTWSSSWTNCRTSPNCRTSSWSKSASDSFKWGICRALCTETLLSITQLIVCKAQATELPCVSINSLLFKF